MFESKALLEKVDFLEKERAMLWERIVDLEQRIELKATDFEKEARQASKKASEFRNRAQERKLEIDSLYSGIDESKRHIDSLQSDSEAVVAQIKEKQLELNQSITDISSDKSSLETKINKIDEILEKHPDLESDLNDFDKKLEDLEEKITKMNVLSNSIQTRKTEIDKLYYSIAGFESENEETGEAEYNRGLKDELEDQYKSLKSNFTTLDDKFNEFFKNKNVEHKLLEEKWDKDYSGIIEQLNTLLPNALTAGLSAAYSEKKKEETVVYESLKTQFNYGIMGLVAISLLTIGISIYFITTDMKFIEIIKILPNLVAATLPIYLPVLWYTFSANRKVRLSKRLIEEYTHKEVLSKTFEGLSTQIKDIKDKDESERLKVKLLFNILQVSNENPGKLISDYKNTDHPVVAVVNQQNKLEDLLSSLKDYPQFEKLADLLADSKLKFTKRKKEQLEKLAKDINDIVDN